VIVMPGLEIPDGELEFVASRSGGPGGQNVNKVSSRVTLRFDIEKSNSLNVDQRVRIQRKLASRINKDGVLQVSSQRTRSQDLNREDVIQRFAELLRWALHEEKPRIETKASRGSKEERLREKRQRTKVKRARAMKGSKSWEE
jgi:ribosome-associated protein